MEYRISVQWLKKDSEGPQQNVETKDLESALLSAEKPTFELKLARLTAKLPIPLEAKVLRGGGKEIVRLISSGKKIDLVRGDDIGVSCNPTGGTVPVQTINISFRDEDDEFTDRGIVWVIPGDPATMMFVIMGKVLKSTGTLAKIAKAAEDAVKTNVLDLFI